MIILIDTKQYQWRIQEETEGAAAPPKIKENIIMFSIHNGGSYLSLYMTYHQTQPPLNKNSRYAIVKCVVYYT